MTRTSRWPVLRTRTALIAAMTFVVACITAASLLIVRRQMERQIGIDVSANLSRSILSFNRLQGERLASQQRNGALLADLPSLKALMTTDDRRTIQDGALEFWRTSDSDLFALAQQNGAVVTAYTRGRPPTAQLAAALQHLLLTPGRYDVVDGDRLFAVTVHPLLFGDKASGTILGFVFTGFAVDPPLAGQLRDASAVNVSFVSGNTILASSLPESLCADLPNALSSAVTSKDQRRRVRLRGETYLAAIEDLSATANRPLQLVLMDSLSDSERAVARVNLFVLFIGVAATLAGAFLMAMLARAVTEPLEALATEVSAFGRGEVVPDLPIAGTAEIRELNAAFRAMQRRITESKTALLESERLATIGRMASSVSHDLRHYLAAVYANAEFLAGPGLSDLERKELYEDIRNAVLGTTELIDSLLLFSRPEARRELHPVPIMQVVRRACTLLEAHPDAEGVELSHNCRGAEDVLVLMDARQIERALFNLLLNACQVERAPYTLPTVQILAEHTPQHARIAVIDNGLGVPAGVRGSLFEPFVSEGKQRGTGLGLTLVQSIAQEHGGRIVLVSTEKGRTVFHLLLPRAEAPLVGHGGPTVGEKSVAEGDTNKSEML